MKFVLGQQEVVQIAEFKLKIENEKKKGKR